MYQVQVPVMFARLKRMTREFFTILGAFEPMDAQAGHLHECLGLARNAAH